MVSGGSVSRCQPLGLALAVQAAAVEVAVNRAVGSGLTPGTGKYRRSETFQADDVLQLVDRES